MFCVAANECRGSRVRETAVSGVLEQRIQAVVAESKNAIIGGNRWYMSVTVRKRLYLYVTARACPYTLVHVRNRLYKYVSPYFCERQKYDFRYLSF